MIPAEREEREKRERERRERGHQHQQPVLCWTRKRQNSSQPAQRPVAAARSGLVFYWIGQVRSPSTVRLAGLRRSQGRCVKYGRAVFIPPHPEQWFSIQSVTMAGVREEQ